MRTMFTIIQIPFRYRSVKMYIYIGIHSLMITIINIRVDPLIVDLSSKLLNDSMNFPNIRPHIYVTQNDRFIKKY